MYRSGLLRLLFGALIAVLVVFGAIGSLSTAHGQNIDPMPKDGTCREIGPVFTATQGAIISLAPYDFVWFDVLRTDGTGYSSAARRSSYDRWLVKRADETLHGQYLYCGYIQEDIEARLRMEVVARIKQSGFRYRALPDSLGANGDERYQVTDDSCTEGGLPAEGNIGIGPSPTATPIPQMYPSVRHTVVYFGMWENKKFTILDKGIWELKTAQLDGKVYFNPVGCNPQGILELTAHKVADQHFQYVDTREVAVLKAEQWSQVLFPVALRNYEPTHMTGENKAYCNVQPSSCPTATPRP